MKKSKFDPRTIIEMYQSAIMAEKEAREKRLELEILLYDSVSSQLHKSEGQETIRECGYKITIDRPVTVKLKDNYTEIIDSIPPVLHFHKTKIEIDRKKFSATISALSLDSKNKKLLSRVWDCVESKPGKVSIKIEKDGE